VDNHLLVEIKPKEQIGWPMNVAKFRAAAKFCKLKGWNFRVIVKEQINPLYLTEQITHSKLKKSVKNKK
jgi:hypothetical protein